MGNEQRVAELKNELVVQQRVVAHEVARFRDLERELLFRSGTENNVLLRLQTRSDAIVTVLRQAGVTLLPKEIAELLHAAGRDDDLKSVTATLSHFLLGQGVVLRPTRGRYGAI